MLENHDLVLQTLYSITLIGHAQATSKTTRSLLALPQVPFRRSLAHNTPTKTDAGSLRHNIHGLRQ
jgi:hypothetical protein